MNLDRDELELIAEQLANLLRDQPIDWPAGRITLTEEEAAAACGVGRHVLRDLRLTGHLKHIRLGRRVVYSRELLLQALDDFKVPSSSNAVRKRNHVEKRAP